ncbi:Fe-S cluster assembly protein SufD [Luteimonas sp. RD2P54]|uniref:Fe-S cluster assembly protein SufD n=1 Tax=Luteimonas endophytica TaxID=3042023 RepID=A0ABT6JBS7_9GAMM|nr:Fe-S cluster assembly protein SufD [Luteimonas endophytica]MDH5824030.1 Fe-S cluster assembly protein SufD [Luteimonas endophytica]
MSALLDSLATGFDGDGARRAMLDAALRDGLPGPRSEAWKYTPLRALERRRFDTGAAAPAVDPAVLAGIPAPRLVFVNGRHDQALSDLSALPAGVSLATGAADAADEGGRFQRSDAVFARLALALAEDGLTLEVAAGARPDSPVHLVFVGAPQGDRELAWHLRHAIRLGDGAQLRMVEHHLSAGAHRHLDNALLALELGEGASLQHARIQAGADGASSFLRTGATLAAAAHYARVDLELGGALSRHELDVRLVGAGARLAANGVLLAGGRRHLDTRLGIEHLARDTSCALLWRGIGTGRGRAVFHGGITIHAGADGTDARLSNKNLLLSEGAEIDTQPVLVIHADEVQAAHGATVGRLDEDALFYLRSRGLPAAEARTLLTAAFAREPLAAVEGAGDALEAHLDRALAALAAP